MSTLSILYNEKDIYKTSRILYWFEAAFANVITVLTTGAYLAKLTSTIGISDGMTAILSALTSLSGVAQLLSVYLSRNSSYKRTVIAFMIPSEIIYALLYLIPFINLTTAARAVIFFAVLLFAKLFENAILPLKITWFMNLVKPERRGVYTSILRISSAVSIIPISLLASYIIDSFEEKNNIGGAFLVLSAIILFFTLSNLLTLLFSREKENTVKRKDGNFKKNFKVLLKDKKYIKLLVVFLLAAIADNVITPFLGTYEVNELNFSMSFISFLITLETLMRIGSMFLFGQLSKKLSHETILSIAYPLTFLAYLLNIFSSPEAPCFYVIYILIKSMGIGAAAISTTNIILEFIPREYQASAISIHTVVSGVLGFLATVCASPFIEFMQKRGNTLFGINVYAQQILSAIAALFYLILIVFYAFSFPRRKKTEEKNYS